jgi:uncharacterized protein YeaO (DUF488 family)
MIKLKRAYTTPSKDDGFRILVERLWPRGVSKERAAIDLWLKDVAPSADLRKWYGHDPKKWLEFRKRYWIELKAAVEAVNLVKEKCKEGPVTFVFAASDVERNSAVALKEFLERGRR